MVWPLELAAAVAYVTEIVPRQVSGEVLRPALAQRNVRWKRAKHWITSSHEQRPG